MTILSLLGVIGYLIIPKSSQEVSKTDLMTLTASQGPSAIADPYFGWSEYKNTKVGFEIKFPSRLGDKVELVAGLEGPDAFANGSEDNTNLIFGATSNDVFVLMVFPYVGSLDDLIKYENKPSSGIRNTDELELVKDINASNPVFRWYKTKVLPQSNGEWQYILYGTGKNHGFEIDFGTNLKDMTELEKIVGSFKFTE